MKIAVLSSHTPSLFWFRADMMKAFLEKGCEVVAIANEDEEKWREKFAAARIKYRSIKVSRNGTNPVADIKTLLSIKKVLSEEKPDTIFSYQAKTVIYGGIAAKRLGIREVYPLIAGMGSAFLSDDIKSRLIRAVLVAGYRKSLKNSRKVFFQNRDDSDIFIKNRILKQEKIVYINGSGVNTETFRPEPLPVPPAFLFIGRLIRDKGVKEYIDACRIVKSRAAEVRCLLVGPYDTNPTAISEAELKPYIDDGTIEYYGEQSDVRPYIRQCGIYVLPSYREGTPKTILEAMACGRAVITTDVPGCRETIIDGESGILVPEKDERALAEKMLYLAEHPELVTKLGEAARKRAEDIYDVKLVDAAIMKTMGIA